MTVVTRLSHGDVDRVLSVVWEAAQAAGPQPFDSAVMERLVELVPADHAGYYEYEGSGRARVLWARKPDDSVWPVPSELLRSWPLHDRRLRPRRTAVKFSDFVPRRARLRHPWYVEVMRPGAVEFECKFLLAAPAGVVRGFFFCRSPGAHDFNERDRAVLTALRPHLADARDRWQRKREPPGLTDRETQIIRLIRDGLTNREIAAELVVATCTVRKHLENIFEKLGVHTRTGAVARAFGSDV